MKSQQLRKLIQKSNPDGTLSTNNSDKANALAHQFSVNHQNPLLNDNPTFTQDINLKVTDYFNQQHVDIINYPTEEEVKGYIKKMKSSRPRPS